MSVSRIFLTTEPELKVITFSESNPWMYIYNWLTLRVYLIQDGCRSWPRKHTLSHESVLSVGSAKVWCDGSCQCFLKHASVCCLNVSSKTSETNVRLSVMPCEGGLDADMQTERRTTLSKPKPDMAANLLRCAVVYTWKVPNMRVVTPHCVRKL